MLEQNSFFLYLVSTLFSTERSYSTHFFLNQYITTTWINNKMKKKYKSIKIKYLIQRMAKTQNNKYTPFNKLLLFLNINFNSATIIVLFVCFEGFNSTSTQYRSNSINDTFWNVNHTGNKCCIKHVTLVWMWTVDANDTLEK